MIENKSQLRKFGALYLVCGLLLALSLAWVINAQSTPSFSDVFNAEDVRLVQNDSIGGRLYSPVCTPLEGKVSTCHLTLRFDNPKTDKLLVSNDFTHLFKIMRGNPVVRSVGYDVYDGNKWVTLNSVNVVQGRAFYVDLWAEIEGEDWQVDSVPCLFGDCQSLAHFALWASYTSGNVYVTDIDASGDVVGQSFYTGGTSGAGTLTNFSFNITNYGSAVSNMVTEIWSYNTSDSKPLANLTTCSVITAAMVPTNPSYAHVDSTCNLALDANTYYIGLVRWGGSDFTGRYQFWGTYSDGYDGGNMTKSINSGSSYTVYAYDLDFYAFKEKCSDIIIGTSIKSNYLLDSDCHYNVSNLTIDSDNVILDCNGATLDQANFYSGDPLISSWASNFTLKNCTTISDAVSVGMYANVDDFSYNDRKLLQELHEKCVVNETC